MKPPAESISHIRASFPQQGFFQDKEWVLSPEAFALDAATVELIRALGPALRAFQRACNRLYFDEAHPWVAKLLDQGKPQRVIELGRNPRWHEDLPRVLRPDLVLTETGVSISELDSFYAAMDQNVIGGAAGMIDAFAAAFPSEDILISRESGDYLPEMSWLADRLGQRVWRPWEIEPFELNGTAIYRFFELFDLANVENADVMLRMAERGEISFTPPIKAFLEEKLWLALFWSPALEDFWKSALSTPHLELLKKCIPMGWVVDPVPLPPFAVWPKLDIQSWHEMKSFGGRLRQLVLKISGFSERGWGSRGVFIGHDLSQEQWGAAIDEALASFPTNPFVLQEFHRAKVVTHPAWDEEKQTTRAMQSRVRLCPYYFATSDEDHDPALGGVLATVCPADKKILHGMRDAMMLPCVAR
ncbi:MAG: hypothetical protein NTX35_05400 [Verrucomicrobia bacterium]|nr:hypothetical protein [Verrucomicrobiota bacterium]